LQLSIGTLFGALIAGPVADIIGRKPSVTLWCGIFCVGNIVMISSEYHWYQMMMGRWVAGLGVGALSLLVPMYMGKPLKPTSSNGGRGAYMLIRFS